MLLKHYIYNALINLSKLVKYMSETGFQLISRGSEVVMASGNDNLILKKTLSYLALGPKISSY